MAYVYEHWRTDTGECFYVGKGSGKRAALKRRPNNPHYQAIVAKLDRLGARIEVRIIADGLTDEQAFALEVDRIADLRASGVRLCNHAAGGTGGMSGIPRSEESRKKQSATIKGRPMSVAQIEANRNAHATPEYRARVSAQQTGRKRPPGTGKKISEAKARDWAENRAERLASLKRGHKASDETRAKQRAAKTPEVRAKISAAVKRQWQNPEFRALVSATMRQTNEKRRLENAQ